MSRRYVSAAALAATVLAGGYGAVLQPAAAAGCPTWTDTEGDASPQQLGAPKDNNLDILNVLVTTSGTDVVYTVGVKALLASDKFTDAGDRFTVQTYFGTANVQIRADRSPTGNTVTVTNISDSTAPVGTATAVYDTTKNAVVLTVKVSELDKVAAKSTAGTPATNLSASSSDQAGGRSALSYDSAPAPTGTTYTVGTPCGDSPAPGPTPPPAPGGLPAGYPRAGCDTIGDTEGDSSPKPGGVTTGYDADLDILGVAVNTTPTDLKAYLRIKKLAMPKNWGGHQFTLTFTVNAKEVVLYAGESDSVNKYGELAVGSPTWATVDGDVSDGATPTATFDKTNNVVVISLALAKLGTAVGGSVAPGVKLTKFVVESWWMIDPAQGSLRADTVQKEAEADRVYTIGDTTCFTPPGVLANVGKTTAQYTDAAAVAAKLTAGGAALAGKAVTFTVGSRSVSANTGADGIARAALNPGSNAGSYSMVVKWLGDASATATTLTVPFTVTAEKTKVVLTVQKSGSKRTVIAKLLDDDNHPVAGQVVTFYINGKKVSSPRTNSAGTVTLATAKPTQTVKASFAAVAGKFLASSAQARV